MKKAQRFTALIALALIPLAAGTATATEGVSPGAVDRMAQVNNACPTFSWGESDGTVVYELVAYVLPEDTSQKADLTADNEVLFSRVAGSATSWTPSADQCFALGGHYVWFVRSVTEIIEDQVIEAGDWSAGRYFTVPVGPSAEEVARAVEVLKQWEAVNGGRVATPSSAGTRSGGPRPTLRRSSSGSARADAGTDSAAPKSVPTAGAAIRGEHPDTSGEAFGLVGISASADGAGVAAANLNGGPDLVLDGSSDGDVDTLIYENTVIRSSSDDQIFLFHNGGGGALDLHVHGSLNGDGLNVQYGPVIDDSGNWLGVGDTIPCVGCVASADIADGSVATTDLVNDAVTGAKIADGAVGASNLRNNAVTTEKIADGTITGADIDPTGWIYVSKSQLYEREESVSIAGTGDQSATAYCDDSNDLPLAASCRVQFAAIRLVGENAVDWTSATDPAGWECLFYNDVGGTYTGTVKLACISVPGP